MINTLFMFFKKHETFFNAFDKWNFFLWFCALCNFNCLQSNKSFQMAFLLIMHWKGMQYLQFDFSLYEVKSEIQRFILLSQNTLKSVGRKVLVLELFFWNFLAN